MKKVILAVVMTMMLGAVTAQSYVRIDTVIRPYIEFDYQGWVDSGNPLYIGATNLRYCCRQDSAIYDWVCGDLVQYNYIEGGADICGLSLWFHCNYGPNDYWDGDAPTGFYPSEYLYLYEATPDSFVQVGQLMIDLLDTVRHSEWTSIWNIELSCEAPLGVVPGSTSPYFNEYRFFFDKPVHVEDSFYVGASYNHWIWIDMLINSYTNGGEPPTPTAEGYYGLMSTEYASSNLQHFGDECQMPYMKQKIRWRKDSTVHFTSLPNNFPLNEWVPTEARDFWMIWPLIKTYDTIWTVDTPACLPVTGFSIMSRFGDTVMLRWNPDSEHGEYQVSYGSAGMNPDSGTFVNVTNNRWRFIDTLHTGDVMVAYVRTVCRELDTLRYSDWSEGVEWQTRNAGVMPPLFERDGLADGVRLMPNPAADGVVLLSNYWMKGVDIYYANGMKYGCLMPQPYTVEFSVKSWPKGMYLMVVHTLVGDVTKKLMVE